MHVNEWSLSDSLLFEQVGRWGLLAAGLGAGVVGEKPLSSTKIQKKNKDRSQDRAGYKVALLRYH